MAASTVGALRVTLGANTANFEAGMKRARREAATSATSIQRSLSGIKSGLVGLTTGLVSGATAGAIVSLGKRALEYAASLGEVSEQLGVATDALQVYRFIGTQVGITQDEMDNSLGRLSDSIAEAGQGTKAQAESFNELGINVKTASGELKTTDRIIREMADAFTKLEAPQERVRIARDLMGRSGGKFITALSGGSKAIQEWTEAAREAGVVISSDDIQKADQLADDLERLNTVLSARIAGTVAENATSIRDLAASIGGLIGEIVDAVAWLNKLNNAFTLGVGKKGGFLGLPTIRRTGIAPWESRIGQIGAPGGITTGIRDVGLPPVDPSATGLNRVAGGRSGGGAGDAERKREQALRERIEAMRRSAQIESDLADGKAEELQAQQSLTDDYVDRAEIQRELIDIEAAQRDAQLDLELRIAELEGVADEQLRTATDQLKSLNGRLQIMKKQELAQEVELDRQRDFEQTQELLYGIQRTLLEGQAQLAETAAERRQIELDILELAYRERRERLQRIIAETNDFEERKRAETELQSLNRQQALDRQGVISTTRGPLEQFSAGLPTTAAKLNEAFQFVAANGLQALEDGILSVIDRTKSLGQAFRDMASQIISDLLRISIQRAIIAPIANAIGLSLGAGQEFVMPADAVQRIGLPALERLRSGTMSVANDRGRAGDNFNMGGIQINAPMSTRQARETGTQLASAFQRRIAMTKRNGM